MVTAAFSFSLQFYVISPFSLGIYVTLPIDIFHSSNFKRSATTFTQSIIASTSNYSSSLSPSFPSFDKKHRNLPICVYRLFKFYKTFSSSTCLKFLIISAFISLGTTKYVSNRFFLENEYFPITFKMDGNFLRSSCKR